MDKLGAEQVETYFRDHLPYRTGIMLAHYKMTRAGWAGNSTWLNACFVASLVTGRMYLNLLGVGKKDGVLVPYTGKQTDVSAEDLGGKRLNASTLTTSERQMFLDFIVMANMAAAHFTTPYDDDWRKTHEVIRVIHGYLKINLYDHTGRTGLEAMDDK